MTRCRQHAQELGGGVCAVCLRERLEALVAVRSAFFEHPPEAPWKPPSPPAVPRSASPYAPVCSWDPDFSANVRRGGCRRSRPALFYGTPLGGPSSSEAASFSIFSTLFGAGGQNSRSEKVADQGCAVSTPGPGSTSWLAALLPWQRKKHQQQHSSCLPAAESAENSAVMRRRRRRRGGDQLWCHGRGMSPAREEEEGRDSAGSGSDCSPESSSNELPRAMPTPIRKAVVPSAGRAMAGFAVCLSPLVRPNPRQRDPGTAPAATVVGVSSDLRGGAALGHRRRRPSGSGGGPPASLCPNRSRKIADFGRFR
ncbi:unnamed protein product [Spirodela intermedia]|uniref:Uncharacterized protein n=1 Tax=Spirodela intermedia TaxID=51605 RepID=A0A7I8LN20_SPIIN|nr:unnamed protein product [Spirodela intermedia]